MDKKKKKDGPILKRKDVACICKCVFCSVTALVVQYCLLVHHAELSVI